MDEKKQQAFNRFWNEHWPRCRRKDKKKTMDVWQRIPPALYEAIYAAVDRQKKQPSWNKHDCAYIPYPHRWLRDRRWEDEIQLPEDNDVEELLNALTLHTSMPVDLPKHIAARFRKMCERVRTNWPQLHYRLAGEHITEAEIKKEYAATA